MIEHVFVLMLENRSFDHLLGWSGLHGTDAVTGEPTAAVGLTGDESNELPNGVRVPVSRGGDYVLTLDPGHNFEDVLEQLCGRGAAHRGGAGGYPPITMGGFASRAAGQIAAQRLVADPACVMRGFGAEQLPVLNALAREFAICDSWFSSMPGPTWPNRYFVHAATSGGLDDSPTQVRSVTALLDGFRFANGTLYDRLDHAGIRWALVEGDALPQALTIAGMLEHAVQGRFITMRQLHERLARPSLDDTFVFIEPHYGHVLLNGANFKCGNSMHPLDDVTRGERLLKDVYEAIRGSRHWPSSLLLVLFDEHGGFYDHVPPPAAVPPGDRWMDGANQHGFAFDRLGVRVPAIVVSPHTQRGLVDHTLYDHTSVAATLEGMWHLEPLTARDRGANRLDHLFALPEPRTDTPATLPEPAASGIADCEDSLLHRIASDLEEIPADVAVSLQGEVDPALLGFVQVAVARRLYLAAARDRDVAAAIRREGDRLAEEFHGVRTKLDAMRFLTGTHLSYHRHREASGT